MFLLLPCLAFGSYGHHTHKSLNYSDILFSCFPGDMQNL